MKHPSNSRPINLPRLALTLIALALPQVSSPLLAATCPPTFGNGRVCTANDFNVTTVLVSGPDECTEGEIIPSVTVRVGLESTAKDRYDIGLFAGDHGGPVIGGASCSFTSLVPLEPPFDPLSGSGGYRELDGDACGEVAKDDGVNFRDFVLTDSVLCRDSDGDSRVDGAGLVTWSSNANEDVCTNPNDETNFFPEQSSKCQLDPDLNLPIVVEPPPSMVVDKVAQPSSLPAPGGPVEFVVMVTNSSAETDPLTLFSLVDDVYGDITKVQGRITRTNCAVPRQIAPGGTSQ
jgi:hypothetical protein